MKYIAIILFLFIGIVNSKKALGQYALNQNKNWYFGNGLGYDFLNNTALTGSMNAAGTECTNALSDANGSLLFYSDGYYVWDKNNNLMPNANPIISGTTQNVVKSTTQGCVFVQNPLNANQYYIFSLTSYTLADSIAPGAGRLYRATIDMTLNGGNGDVVAGSKVLVDSNLSEKMITAPSCQGVWLIVHSRDTNVFKSYLINPSGVSATPVLSQTGSYGYVISNAYGMPQNHNAYFATGQLALSPNNQKIAAAYFNGNKVELYDFNSATGVVSNAINVDSISDDYSFYGVSFSPDNNKLYVSNCAATLSNKAINQYNVSLNTAAQIHASKVYLMSANAAIAQLQLASDGKIYFDGNYYGYLGAINNPNVLGTGCNANNQALAITNQINYVTKPGLHNTFNLPINIAGTDTIATLWKDTTICDGANVMLKVRSGGLDYTWENGSTDTSRTINQSGTYWVSYLRNCVVYVDTYKVHAFTNGIILGADTAACHSITVNVSSIFPVSQFTWQDGFVGSSYPVSKTGIYYVSADYNGCKYTDSINVTIVDNNPHLRPDTSICLGNGFNIEIKANVPPSATIMWNTGSNQPEIQTNQYGTYIATVNDSICGVKIDSVQIISKVCDCEVYVPNAFSPNGDGNNDVFGIKNISGCSITGFQLNIYNRWGKQIFSSMNADNKWDGTYNGTPLEIGTYYYYISLYKGTSNEYFSQKGDVTLIR